MVEKTKRIIVSVTNDLSTDQRVKKVCAFLHEMGFDITLCGRLLKGSKPITDRPYQLKRFRLWFNKGPLFYANYNIRLWFFLIFKKTDFLLANDLDTLLANAWVKRLKKTTILVYDSHEYFTEVPEIQNKPLVKKTWQWIEKKSMPFVDQFYTVNESIADIYRKQTGKNVLVVRNISDPKYIKLTYNKAELGLPSDKKIVIMQGAGINVDRGAEEAVDAIKLVPDSILIFVGDGDAIPALKQRIIREGLEDKVLFFPKQPYDKLMNYTQHADLGLALDKPNNLNYKLALPNKLFDYIHAGIPVLSSNLIEIERIISTHKIGRVINNHDPKHIADQMKTLLFDDHLIDALKTNCQKAAKSLTWQNETKILRSIYE